MNQITIKQIIPEFKYLLVSRKEDSETISTTRLVISDNYNNNISFINISKGDQGEPGPVGPVGPPGKDAPVFDILPLSSGGTNNNVYISGNILYFDGLKISTSSYSIEDILIEAQNGANAITGILNGSGISKTQIGNTVTLNAALGSGLTVDNNNNIIVDQSIARVSDLKVTNIDGILPIDKGGTNNTFYNQNQLIYFDGIRFKSFPIATGNFLFSGISVNIVAGSGLVGGGNLTIPSGTIAINIPSSADILVEENLVSLTPTGIPGTYSKVVTDTKGRVVQGSSLTTTDIISILGYTPFHQGNDGAGSNLDADLLDGQHGDFYRNASNITGLINPSVLPPVVTPGTYTKFSVTSNGLISEVLNANQSDIISSLGYTPVPNTGNKNILGKTTFDGDMIINNGKLSISDNLPILATNNSQILPDTPRGISFVYGGLFSNKTGLIAYYPAQDELKLVTNIFASGADTDAGGNQDDLNGGDAESIFRLQNLQGDSSTVVIKSVADQTYVKINEDEEINGSKTFNNNVIFKKVPIQISNPIGNTKPPFHIANNINKIESLNSDLLDDQHGSYYRNAVNITGSFSYNNVKFDHIAGTHRYIPRFNDTINQPAGRISDSNLYQTDAGNIVLDNNVNLIIGYGNVGSSTNSVIIGQNNVVGGNNNLAVGSNNIVSGNNSIALNRFSSVVGNNSVALNNYGRAYTNNQIAFGSFSKKNILTNQELEHAQHTTITMALEGVSPGNSWISLTPTIIIPENKTFAYNLDVLITRAFGTGVAQYRFDSGIFKNATFRNSNNVVQTINLTTHPQLSKKDEIFNNSQIKNHFHTFEHINGDRALQEIKVTHPPLNYNTIVSENTPKHYFFTKENKKCSGTYIKTNDGNLILDISNPIYSGNFQTNSNTYGIKISNKNHGVTNNSSISLAFSDVSGLPLLDQEYKVLSVVNNDIFFVEQYFYTGYLSYVSGNNFFDYANIVINQDSIVPIDSKYFVSGIGGTINNNIISILNNNSNFTKNLKINSAIIIQSGEYFFNRLVTNLTNNTISINDPIATGSGSTEIYRILNGPINLYQIDFTFNLFKNAPRLLVKTPFDGDQFFNTSYSGTTAVFQGTEPFVDNSLNLPTISTFYTTGNYSLQGLQNSNSFIQEDFSNKTSIVIKNLMIPKRTSYGSGIPVSIAPLTNNTGSVFLGRKNNVSGSFLYDITQYNKYRSVYTKYADNQIVIHHTGLDRQINLPFTPVYFELVSGFGDDDNSFFSISNINNQYYLNANHPFNYEEKNLYKIRIKSFDRSQSNTFEKNFTISINDTKAPYSLIDIEHQYVNINNSFFLDMSNIFYPEENEGPLTFYAKQKNGTSIPYWLNFDPTTISFSGDPSYCDIGTYSIRVYTSNNSATIFKDFLITVEDNVLSQLNYDNNYNSKITNIILESNSIDENLPSGSLVGKLNINGSYHPYLDFISGENTFSGIFRNNSDIVETIHRFTHYPTTTLSGTANLLNIGSNIVVPNNLNMPNNLIATNVYKPFILSGTPALFNGNIFWDNAYSNYTNTFFSGLQIQADYYRMPPKFNIQYFTDYSANVGGRQAIAIETREIWKDLLLAENDDILVIRHSPLIPTILSTEIPENLLAEDKDEKFKIIANDRLKVNTTWAIPYSGCNNGLIINNQIILDTIGNITNENNFTHLNRLNETNKPDNESLIYSDLTNNTKKWYIRNTIANPVLTLYNLGSSEFGKFLTEDNNLILMTENNINLISNNENHHGTRIVSNNSYEILESKYVVKDNGYLSPQLFDYFITENADRLVYDYAVAARSGDISILYPGQRTDEYFALKFLGNELHDFTYAWGTLIPFVFSNNKTHVKLNHKYIGSPTLSTLTYNESLPTDTNYAISGLKIGNYSLTSGNCPSIVFVTGIKGFETRHLLTGYYTTGLVDIYSEPGTGTINLNFNKDINLDPRYINNIYLNNVVSNVSNLQLPIIGEYKDIEIVGPKSIKIKNKFYMPNSGIISTNTSQRTGSFTANIDSNHGYIVEPSSVVNRIPAAFKNVITRFTGVQTASDLRPKDYTFDVVAISGNKIYIKDNKNYLLKENNRPDYLDQTIKGSYLTNGIIFSGSLFNNNSNIYDIRYNQHALDEIYTPVHFAYNHGEKSLTFNIQSGLIKPYDNIFISFPSGFNYSNNIIESLIFKESILSTQSLIDLEPHKDSLLLESSQSIDPSINIDQIKIKAELSVNSSTLGTCTINNNIINRLQPKLLINHSGSTIGGYEINSFVSGFSFSGFIPKDHKIISTNIDNQLTNDHIGYASIFSSGNQSWYSGARLLRSATESDIGYSEYYLINTNIVTGTLNSQRNISSYDLGGVGTSSSPFMRSISSTGLQFLEFLYLGHNSNSVVIQGNIIVSHGALYIYHTDLDKQLSQYRASLSQLETLSDHLIYSGIFNGNTINSGIDLMFDIDRFSKIKIEFVSYNPTNKINLSTYINNEVALKPYILESSGALSSNTPFYPYFNPLEPSFIYTPVPTLGFNNCIDCDTKLPQYIPSLNPSYSIFNNVNFYILPYIRTNNLYCGQTYDKNRQIFYNGNIIEINNFDSVYSYLEKNDEVKILAFNNIPISNSGVTKYLHKFNNTNERTIISGISVDGLLSIPPKNGLKINTQIFENRHRYNLPFGINHNTPILPTGNIEFIKSCSGEVNIYDYNNMYYHTYGGITASFPLDNRGEMVSAVQTGIYKVSNNSSLCSSGTLCVIISGYRNSSFTGLIDVRNRSNFNYQSNVVEYNGVKGVVRPFGIDKLMFFDFDDGFSEISDRYPIEDALSPNVISLNIPYNSNYINKSGLVLIIDSNENIKSNLNPNKDNNFLLSEANFSIGSFGQSLGNFASNRKIFNYYDNDSKRWKHTIHFSGSQPPFLRYSMLLGGISSNFYSINSERISISGISHSIDNGETFINTTELLNLPDNISEIIFKITTLNGDQNLFQSTKSSTPKVSVSGISDYSVEFNRPDLFGWHGSGWNIGLRIKPPPPLSYNNKNITIRARDFTGHDDYSLTLNKNIVPEVSIITSGFAFSGSVWNLGFDISKINVESKINNNEIFLELSNIPIANSYQTIHKDSTSVIFSGPTVGSNTGLYNVRLDIRDITKNNNPIIASGSGSLTVAPIGSSLPSYNLILNNFKNIYYLNIDKKEKIIFYIPAELGCDPSQVLQNLVITFGVSQEYSIAILENFYDYNTKRFKIVAQPINPATSNYVNFTGRYTTQSVSISLRQPIYDNTGSCTYQTYTKSFFFVSVFYKDIVLQSVYSSNNLFFDNNQPWSLEFNILYGVGEHNQAFRPSLSVFNSPNLGIYENTAPTYSIEYIYETGSKLWKALAVGNKDIFDRYSVSTGSYPIQIYATDNFSSSDINNNLNITYQPFSKMKNVNSTIFSTPNNLFFTKVDTDSSISETQNPIFFPPTLKESSIVLPINNTVRKYDKNFGIWENSYISNKMLDKYDARIVLNNNVLSVQCKGIGSDKIIAIAKLNTLEIESNELSAIPLKITGITDYSPGGSIKIENPATVGWTLNFKTIGGLAHINYPPTIILQNMPTFCSGFNPLSQDQYQCLASPPVWDPNDRGGSWSYSFSGLPSCNFLGLKPFSILAIDTNPNLLPDSPYLPITDFVEYAFDYKEIQGEISALPPEIILDPDVGNNKMLPFCNIEYYQLLNFGPFLKYESSPCLRTITPTGIKSIVVNGSVPSGLSYNVFFPEPPLNEPKAPYSNLSSGYIEIRGFPLTFASGGAYNEELTIVVTDARNLFKTYSLKFADASRANDPDISLSVYFDKNQPLLTRKSGLDILNGNFQVPVWRPSPSPLSLGCNSILPHNKCKITDVFYSGTLDTNTKIYITPINSSVSFQQSNIIYISFDSNNTSNNGTYTIGVDNTNKYHITGVVSLNVSPTGYARAVVANHTRINLNNFDILFNGSIIDNTSYCLLGGGRAKAPQDGTGKSNRGLLGLLVPSHKASITGFTTGFSIDNEKLEGLKFDKINDNPTLSRVAWSDCWQTGSLYISGIILPNIYAEVTDPPPAQNRLFTFNNLIESLFARLSFGDNESQRNLPENQRSKNIQYIIEDLISNQKIAQGYVSAQSAFATPFLFSNSGTVYKLKVWNESDIFPTYDFKAIPYSENEYLWIHKADLLNTIPTQKSFPPVITAGFDKISVVNDLSDNDPNGFVMDPVIGLAVGGYVPSEDGIGISIPYSHTGVINNSRSWSTQDYFPIISGIIQKNLCKKSEQKISTAYTFINNTGIITLNNITAADGDVVSITFTDTGGTIRYQNKLILNSTNIENQKLVIKTSLIGTNFFNGFSSVVFGSIVENIDLVNNQIVIKNSNIQYDVNDNLCIDKNNTVSTELGPLSHPGQIFVISGDSSMIYLSNTNTNTGWLRGFGSDDFVTVYQNINDNIKIMPQNTTYLKEGQFIFRITGRSNTRQNEDLIYKIATMENPNMPIFDNLTYPGVNFVPKKYFQNYPLYVNKPIKILNDSIVKNGSELTFSLIGGERPINQNFPDIKLSTNLNSNFSYCGFWRHTFGTGNTIEDQYDPINDRLNVKLRLSSEYGVNWLNVNQIGIRVSDQTGFDEVTYILT